MLPLRPAGATPAPSRPAARARRPRPSAAPTLPRPTPPRRRGPGAHEPPAPRARPAPRGRLATGRCTRARTRRRPQCPGPPLAHLGGRLSGQPRQDLDGAHRQLDAPPRLRPPEQPPELLKNRPEFARRGSALALAPSSVRAGALTIF